MVRFQLNLTEHQHDALAALAKATGRTQSELIREAVDLLIKESRRHRAAVLARAAGMWRKRKDLPEFQSLRAGWDRYR